MLVKDVAVYKSIIKPNTLQDCDILQGDDLIFYLIKFDCFVGGYLNLQRSNFYHKIVINRLNALSGISVIRNLNSSLQFIQGNRSYSHQDFCLQYKVLTHYILSEQFLGHNNTIHS